MTMTPRLSRRNFILGSSAGAALLGSGAVAQTVPAPINEITAGSTFRWIDSGDQKAVFFKKFFADYAAARDVNVVYDPLPWNEIARVIPLGVRNKTAPDVFVLPRNTSLADAVAQGWMQPYDDFIPDIETWKAKFPTGAFLPGINVFDGKTYGLPFTSNKRYSTHLLYNKGYMEAAGYDPENKPLTQSEFREAARKITEAGKGRYFGFILGGSQLNRWQDAVRNMGRMAGASAGGDSPLDADIDLRTGEYVFDSDQYIAAVELLIAMNDDGSFFPGLMNLNAPQARAYVPQGAAGMILQGPWNIPGWEAEHPDFGFGVASGPVPDEGPTGKLTISQAGAVPNTLGLWAGSDNGAIAGEIFQYLGTLEGQVEWGTVVGAGDPPIMPDAIEMAEFSPRSRAILNHFNDAIRVGPNPIVRNADLARVISSFIAPDIGFARTVQGLVSGEMKGVAQEMRALKDRYDAALDTAFEKARADGAQVNRADLVFSNWDPDIDFAASDY